MKTNGYLPEVRHGKGEKSVSLWEDLCGDRMILYFDCGCSYMNLYI